VSTVSTAIISPVIPTHSPTSSADLDAARLLLSRLGVSPADLLTAPQERTPAPTFAEYIPIVSRAVTDGTRRMCGTYWNRVLEHWGDRRLDEPTPSEIKELVEYVQNHVVVRRNARGGRSAAKHLIAALRRATLPARVGPGGVMPAAPGRLQIPVLPDTVQG
jgi:hypothetical protein